MQTGKIEQYEGEEEGSQGEGQGEYRGQSDVLVVIGEILQEWEEDWDTHQEGEEVEETVSEGEDGGEGEGGLAIRGGTQGEVGDTGRQEDLWVQEEEAREGGERDPGQDSEGEEEVREQKEGAPEESIEEYSGVFDPVPTDWGPEGHGVHTVSAGGVNDPFHTFLNRIQSPDFLSSIPKQRIFLSSHIYFEHVKQFRDVSQCEQFVLKSSFEVEHCDEGTCVTAMFHVHWM